MSFARWQAVNEQVFFENLAYLNSPLFACQANNRSAVAHASCATSALGREITASVNRLCHYVFAVSPQAQLLTATVRSNYGFARKVPVLWSRQIDHGIHHFLQQHLSTNPSLPTPNANMLNFIYTAPGIQVIQGGARRAKRSAAIMTPSTVGSFMPLYLTSDAPVHWRT